MHRRIETCLRCHEDGAHTPVALSESAVDGAVYLSTWSFSFSEYNQTSLGIESTSFLATRFWSVRCVLSFGRRLLGASLGGCFSNMLDEDRR